MGAADGGHIGRVRQNCQPPVSYTHLVVDAAIYKLIRMVGGVTAACSDPAAERGLGEFLRTVPAGRGQYGVNAFLEGYLDACLLYTSDPRGTACCAPDSIVWLGEPPVGAGQAASPSLPCRSSSAAASAPWTP